MPDTMPRLATMVAITVFLALVLPATSPRAQIAVADTSAAIDPDATVSGAAIARLRARGPAGLDALLAAHATDVESLRAGPTSTTPALERLRHAIDVVAGQRDAHASGLYFHTDLEVALAEARRRSVPVLSLQLLGRLDEEMSCANSRYFRTLLYSDTSLAAMLRERFVLHWSSERPAPRITIDMGDGRRLERTITGNSIHYLIDPSGRVIDALPGLYDPARFRALLERAETASRACADRDGSAFRTCMVARWTDTLDELAESYAGLRRADPTLPEWAALGASPEARRPTARNAMAQTISKAFVERPILDAIARRPTPRLADGIDWSALVRVTPVLAPSTLALLRLKTGRSDVAAIATELGRNAAADSLRDDLVMHRRILEWLRTDPALVSRDALNARVYTEIFLTPRSDPWLGLRSDEAWDAIEAVR